MKAFVKSVEKMTTITKHFPSSFQPPKNNLKKITFQWSRRKYFLRKNKLVLDSLCDVSDVVKCDINLRQRRSTWHNDELCEVQYPLRCQNIKQFISSFCYAKMVQWMKFLNCNIMYSCTTYITTTYIHSYTTSLLHTYFELIFAKNFFLDQL